MDLLKEIGQRVRTRRTANQWTVRECAARAGLSVRFLSELESGRGNISIVRLAGLAAALEVPLPDLLPGAGASDSTRAQVWSLIERLPEEELVDVVRWLRDRLGDKPELVVALVGLRGAGKSTIGQTLGRRLGVEFVELDGLIEKEADLSLSDLFTLHGESYYKRLAHDLIHRLLSRNQCAVIAIGGSIVTDPDTWSLLKNRCHTVWLKASPEDHWKRVLGQGDTRPMANRTSAMSELRAILAQRSPLYAEAAITVDTSAMRSTETVRAIVSSLPARNPMPSGSKKGRSREAGTR